MIKPMIFRFRCPSELKSALETKAAEEMTNLSACVRRLLVRSLVAEGTVVSKREAADEKKTARST
jgi:hypothetical protein